VEARFPGAFVDPLALPGERLGDLAQDCYSYRYALISLGADSPAQLESRYGEAVAMLPFEFARPPAAARGQDVGQADLVPG
jgi:hypothetical protein